MNTSDLSAAGPVNLWKRGGLSWSELGRRLWKEIQDDEVLGRGAQLAYYFLLAVFPMLLFLTALLGLFPVNTSTSALLQYAEEILPADALSILQRYLDNVVQGSGTEILSLGILGALWVSSSGITAIIDALNVAYDATETRPLWKVRLTGILLTIGLAGFVILSAVLVVYGDQLAEWASDLFGFGTLLVMTWKILQWPLAFILMVLAIGIIYYVCPNVEQEWRWVTPGAVTAVLLWICLSLAFKLYVTNFGNYNAAYGSIGGVIVLMLWLYLSGTVILLGGEINAEIEAAARDQASNR
ncbi:MAG: YihY/virulence factor BrkB family protein [Nitrospira sp.]|nr:YihY/virulence factor BrkB family protein [Nitrospira sp.]MDR4469457.1 YihY/virulence factor BrkB family protein [Nitrospira sp.]